MTTPDFEVQITAINTDHYTEPFAAPDKVAIMALVEKTDATGGTLKITPQHSADGGRTWISKTQISMSPGYNGTAVTPVFGSDDGTVPNMELMRLAVQGNVGTPNVRLFVNGRNY